MPQYNYSTSAGHSPSASDLGDSKVLPKNLEGQSEIVILDPVLRSGFTQIPNVVLADAQLSSHAKVLYALLLMHAWQKGRCFPGQARLAALMGLSDRFLREALRELSERALIKIQRRGLTKTNYYYILPLQKAYPVLECAENAEFIVDRNYSSDQDRNQGSDKEYKEIPIKNIKK